MGNFMNVFSNMGNLMQMFNQFRQNPMGAMMQMGYNVPQHLQNNPEGMVNYLRNSGQMTEQQFQQFSLMAQQFSQNNMPNNFQRNT